MRITFPDDAPGFDGSSLTVQFTARVDGEPVICAITAEALEDHFGDRRWKSRCLPPSNRAGAGSARSAPKRSIRAAVQR
jgi:hypothetical protein